MNNVVFTLALVCLCPSSTNINLRNDGARAMKDYADPKSPNDFIWGLCTEEISLMHLLSPSESDAGRELTPSGVTLGKSYVTNLMFRRLPVSLS